MSLANGRFLQDKAFQPLCQRLAGPGRKLASATKGSCCSDRITAGRQVTDALPTDAGRRLNGPSGREPAGPRHRSSKPMNANATNMFS